MAWLGTWANRRKITIHNTNVDDNVTHYPLPVFLGTSVGIDTDDVSDIFDEVGANSKKIAFTKDDGITELYAEIDDWDDSGETAVLWVSKSDWTIDSTSDTEIYIYYDNTEADNTTYVNTTDSTAAISVWDDNYIGVWHLGLLGSDGTPGEFKDSSGTGNHGTGAGFPTQIDGKIGKAQDFNGSDEEVNIDAVADDIDVTEGTISVWMKMDTSVLTDAEPHGIVDVGWETGVGNFIGLRKTSSDDVVFRYREDNTNADATVTDISGYDEWKNVVGVWKTNNDSLIYVDGALFPSSSSRGADIAVTLDQARIGNEAQGTTKDKWFLGIIDEVRISDIARGADWLKVDYYSQDDNIVSWSAAEHRGWVGGDVNTITNANVGKVNSVSKVDIAKINTV